jgi:hypothetical protein
MSILNGLGILELDGNRCELKTERGKELSQHFSQCVEAIVGYLCIHPTFPYRIKRKVLAGTVYFQRLPQVSDPE